ncbi:small nuclear ribonucleoprotein u1a [Ophiostoma piceae UAMH 11346]|uniref:Small nuclear ribonucleoprotein u1a n=1 Tax=Ophiostoma piceae (strain UAMH 11346) TaxID=1262450 RepID=S3BSF1_OPHP1|nr:small nuclear ribonucleoprotein u1a [Ophiostoma piceae UAMH 11346]
MDDGDADIRLQRVAGDLIGEFDDTLRPFLYSKTSLKKTPNALKVKERVRIREADRMVGLLDPFQEFPQLLDAHLAKWLPLLAEAFLQAVNTPASPTQKKESSADSFLCPLQAAVARILYTLCKVRGEKVIVTFLPVEAKHLDPLLGALEAHGEASWSWEERYIVLLWLAQLLLAPFDLATIGGEDYLIDGLPVVEGFTWPSSAVPPITLRVVPLSITYLAHPGKERDAARALLVRVAMRRDMQRLGIRHALVQWALGVLGSTQTSQASQTGGSQSQPYFYIGTLSFLAGILSAAAGASDMDDALASIFAAVHAVAEDDESIANPTFDNIRSSALARKMIIKAMRAIVVRYIQKGGDDEDGDMAVETTIGYLLGRLADNDTPVRFAASKALGVIALRLDQEMAAQVIDAVLEALERNVLYDKHRNADLTAVDPLEWHGLMLTLAHLLYRRSPPLDALQGIVRALQRGLAFERRSVSGSATGTNVRDAACFGIWAMARRYTTKELLSLDGVKVLQTLATDLVVAAALDPAGNIRRGSSAALQEMIGRHPDTVRAGIPLVQVVDYHSVALRSRAATEVAQRATALDYEVYGKALQNALLGWRGVGDAGDAEARRVAALSYGQVTKQIALSSTSPFTTLQSIITPLVDRILQLQPRQVEEWHGFVLALAAVLDTIPQLDAAASTATDAAIYKGLLSQVSAVLEKCKALNAARRPDLLTEAASRLIVSSFPVVQVLGRQDSSSALVSGPELLVEANVVPPTRFQEIVSSFTPPSTAEYTTLVTSCLAVWLLRQEADVVAAASDAAVVLLVFSGPSSAACASLMSSWAEMIRKPGRRTGAAAAAASSFKARGSGSTAGGSAHIFSLTKAYPLFGDSDSNASLISTAILDRWTADKSIDTRVALLQALSQSAVLRTSSSLVSFKTILSSALDDYTIDARGDVGSHVRLQALKATQVMGVAPNSILLLKTLRLASEKLDRVRIAAQSALVQAIGADTELGQRLQSHTFSSQAYFETLLEVAETLATPAAALSTLMRGYVTSADTGNEELVVASRAALVKYVGDDSKRKRALWTALCKNLPVPLTGKGPPDRIVVPTLEVVVILFYSGVFGQGEDDGLMELCAQVSTAADKIGSVRKVEACIKLYGAVALTQSSAADEARKRLAALLQHPWPRVRTAVVDELWGLGIATQSDAYESLKSTDWGVAEVLATEALAGKLGLV